MIKTSEMQEFLVILKRLRWRETFWLHCSVELSILKYWWSCATFKLKGPAVHQVGCRWFSRSQKQAALGATPAQPCVRKVHIMLLRALRLASLNMPRFWETQLLTLVTQMLYWGAGSRRKTFAPLLNSLLWNSFYFWHWLYYVQIQRLFFPCALKAQNCFATVPNQLQGLQSIWYVCVC